MPDKKTFRVTYRLTDNCPKTYKYYTALTFDTAKVMFEDGFSHKHPGDEVTDLKSYDIHRKSSDKTWEKVWAWESV